MTTAHDRRSRFHHLDYRALRASRSDLVGRTATVDSAVNEYARLRYAYETHDMAMSMFGMLWPWKWAEWFRTYREVKRRLRYLSASRGYDQRNDRD